MLLSLVVGYVLYVDILKLMEHFRTKKARLGETVTNRSLIK
jgi:hypothetical protein